ncbi:MAG: hypothetical protein ACE5M4_14750 [Anaerolineales bacterium]
MSLGDCGGGEPDQAGGVVQLTRTLRGENAGMRFGLAAVIITLAAMTCDSILATPIRSPDFRGLSWYATLDEVKKRETAKLLRQEKGEGAVYLWYKTKLFGEPVTVFYAFDPICEQLFLAEYRFDNTLTRIKFYLVRDTLKKQYGPWKSKHYVYHADEYESYIWLTEHTQIAAHRESSIRHAPKSTITYNTSDWNWLTGFKEGMEPDCGLDTPTQRLDRVERETDYDISAISWSPELQPG